MVQRPVVWAAVSMMSLLGVGCAAWVEPAVSITPALQGQGATLLPTPIHAPTPTLSAPATLSPASTPEPTPLPTPTEETSPVKFAIVYDNNTYTGARDDDPALRTAWGFSCWVETSEATVLFDAGGDGPTLLGNMAQMGLDPRAIDAVVLSHVHGDHTGGLSGLLDTGARPVIYVPASFPASFKAGVRDRTDVVEVTGPAEIFPGIHTTGEVGSSIVEQALVVETGDGLVVVTGCAHPGVVEMVRRAKEAVGGEVALVMGGFHLGSASPNEIEDIVADFRRLGVQQVAPCHCTGDQARQMFADAFGVDCILAGVGYVVTIDRGGGR